MLKSDFQNYTGLFGRGTHLNSELLALVEHAEMHPQTAVQLKAKFDADVAVVQAALTAAAGRTESTGPGGSTLIIATTSLAVTPETASVVVAATTQLTATPTPANASGTTTWASSDPAVATVSASGLVTGVTAGSATITATRGGKTDTCAVTVAEA